MRLFHSAALACCLALAAVAQQPGTDAAPAKEPPAGVLHSISVKGNKLYTAEAIERVYGLKIGQHVTGAIFEAARKRLLAAELFNNVSDDFRYTGRPPQYDLTIEVSENDLVYPMRFERLGVDHEALRDYLKEHVELFADRIPGSQAVLARYTAAIQEFARKTDPAMRVKAQVLNESASQLSVLFAPDAPIPTIAQFLVTGNDAIDTGTLLRAINDVAIGAPFTEARIQQILDGAVKRVYAAKGYMGVTFPKIDSERSKTNLGYIVKAQIQEGPVYKVGAIRFHGSELDQDEIRSTISFKPGEIYNGDRVESFRTDLSHRMVRRGYLDIKVDNETKVDDAKHVVEVTYNIIPGSLYTFKSLDIQGLDLVSEPVIQKLWGEKPGKPFNPDYPQFFLDRVKEQGLFDNLADMRSDYTADPASHGVVVHLYFKGGKAKPETTHDRRDKDKDKDPQQGPPLMARVIASVS